MAVAGAILRAPVIRIEKEVARRGPERLKTHGRLLVETKTPVDAQHLIVLLDEVVTRRHHAE